MLKMTKITEVFELKEVKEKPVVSFLRDFSAPIILETEQTLEQLKVLSKYDENTFVRWESLQNLALTSLMQAVADYESQTEMALLPEYAEAFSAVLKDDNLDLSLKALALTLPDLTYLGEQYSQIPVEAVYEAYQFTFKALAKLEESLLLSIYYSLASEKAYEYSKEAIAQRKLKNICLKYLIKLPNQINIAVEQFKAKQNMTDVLAALASLAALSHTNTPELEQCLDDFYQVWYKDSLVLDKWFALQASSYNESGLDTIKSLVLHKDFSYTNPNRVRSVLGVFGRLNLLGFHQKNGAGYLFLEEQIIKMNNINPQIAARLLSPFTHWKKFDKTRQALMKDSLKRILDEKGLSKDVFEIASKSLKPLKPLNNV